ncbi:MAG: DNA-directed RNA polymerase subunit beta' [Patescibacteria group bacterium]
MATNTNSGPMMSSRPKSTSDNTNFSSISIRLASPEKIREWSYGEVEKPETINYRTQRSERGGLFDEKIFGPEKDFECYCGKYRRIRYKDIICEKCGVEVTRSIVRRERMGHIELAAPVAHIWFLRGGGPSRIGLLLNLSISDLEKVIYFAGYIVTKVNDDEKAKLLKELDSEYKSKVKSAKSDEGKEKIKDSLLEVKRDIDMITQGRVLDEALYHKFSMRYGSVFEAEIGAEAVFKLFKNLDLTKLETQLLKEEEEASPAERIKVLKRLNIVKSMRKAGVRPEWMFLTAVPVTPPALRPMVALDGGRHATSDVNDLYRRVINRNNRLKKLQEINAPDVIQRNEKRILQEAVDALIDNSIRHGSQAGSAVSQAQRRPLKSLADMLKGKQGRFRQNLLGKRVDYSGRSVIVVGPDLRLDQCGLPKHMALELFRPFVISKLLERELAFNIRGAGRLIEEGIAEVWAILEEVIAEKYVLLNRAPTLHRLGIQAFRPKLIEGNAIQLHPLVCTAFNADFDGDQMAVHVPLSDEAQHEARTLMSSARNLLRPGSGDPIVTPKLDIVLGCYWMSRVIPGEMGEGKVFASPNAAITGYDLGQTSFRAKIKVKGTSAKRYDKFGGDFFETTVGRLMFNSILPDDFPYVNAELTSKEVATLVDELIDRYGIDAVPPILDKIKQYGYRYVTKSGVTWSIFDVKIPAEKVGLVDSGRKAAAKIESNYQAGLLSEDERYRMIIELWQGVKDSIEKLMLPTQDPKGAIHDMVTSKARGSIANITQMAGMKGLVINPSGDIIDFPIIPSYKEGLSPLEYFITAHGARKGGADTALMTARAGYLTRRLVDVAQDVIISEEDCGNAEGNLLSSDKAAGLDTGMDHLLRGRMITKAIKGKDGKQLFAAGTLLSKKDAKAVEEAGVREAWIRSPLTCRSVRGICQKCYGRDMGRAKLVELGEAVGVVAAQAIGEPATQLTMRTFHAGGVASAQGDITMGLPRVEEVFERRTPKNAAVIADVDGTIIDIITTSKEKTLVLLPTEENRKGGAAASAREYPVPYSRTIVVEKGADVKKGDILTDGSIDISELFRLTTRERTEEYILNELNKVYSLQGASIARKHMEVIIRQMFSRRRITKSAGTYFVSGDIVELSKFLAENERIEREGGEKAESEAVVLGISEVSLTTASWLSSASFQNTSRILIDSALRGEVDALRGLKENVIIGRLIPAGTGFRSRMNTEAKETTEE